MAAGAVTAASDTARMKVLTRRISSAAAALTLLGACVIAGSTPAAAARVSASQVLEAPITISFVNPHYPQAATDQARALANDVNNERIKRGLSALVADDTLNRFALAKAIEMASRGYFGHTDPDGITFQDRLRAWHWPNLYTAENIAFDSDELHAHAAFMKSAPHAANLLDPQQRRMGIAVVTVGAHETFYVEDFSS
ncbi:MAG: hypothetical protein QOF71_1173 [Candidatus Eremiobacteraeota bacterium]|jgi:uncharacterized protein YkwD|nr:hypothetical protein [Candidatus Eremiobacteraeota bacterium]